MPTIEQIASDPARTKKLLADLGALFDAMKPLFDAVNKSMEDFAEAMRRDPQLARLIEEHARSQGLAGG